MKNKIDEKKKIEDLGEEFRVSAPLEKIEKAKIAEIKEVPQTEPQNIILNKEQTLKEFIDDHQKLLSIIGFFAAFGVIWNQLVQTQPLNIISYLCFLATASLMFEIFKGFKNLKDTPNTIFFKTICYGIFVSLLMNLIFAFPENFQKVIVNNLYLIIIGLIIYAGDKYIGGRRKSLYENYLKQISALSEIEDSKRRSDENKTINLDYLKQDLRLDFILGGIAIAALIVSMITYFFLTK